MNVNHMNVSKKIREDLLYNYLKLISSEKSPLGSVTRVLCYMILKTYFCIAWGHHPISKKEIIILTGLSGYQVKRSLLTLIKMKLVRKKGSDFSLDGKFFHEVLSHQFPFMDSYDIAS